MAWEFLLGVLKEGDLMISVRKWWLFVGMLCSVVVSYGCSSSQTAESAKKEDATEQPTDVAGGFGLTCTSKTNHTDIFSADYDCSYLDKSGNNLSDSGDLASKTSVTIGNQPVQVTLRKSDAKNNFTFTTPKGANVKLISKFAIAKNGDTVMKETIYSLQEVTIYNDVTLDTSGNPSTCADTPANCTIQDAQSRSWWSMVISPDGGLSYSDATNRCSSLIYNGQPNTSYGTSRLWRLPTLFERDQFIGRMNRLLVVDRRIKIDAAFWSERSSMDYSATEKRAVACVLDRFDRWTDITTTVTGAPSDCGSTPDRCTKLDEQTKLWWSKPQSPASGLTWSEAKSACSALSYNGKTGWRLPTRDEQISAKEHDIVHANSDQWISSAFMSKNFWSRDFSTKDEDAYSTTPISVGSGSWLEPVSTLNTVACVRPDRVYWEDVTDGGSCVQNQQNCVLKLSSTNMLYSGVLTGIISDTYKTWSDAKSLCQSYNPPGIGGQGTWTLPTMQQMLDANANSLKLVEGWSGGRSMMTAFWSSETDAASPNLANTMTFLYGSTGRNTPSSQLQVFCVKPATF